VRRRVLPLCWLWALWISQAALAQPALMIGTAPYIQVAPHAGLYLDTTGRLDVAQVAAMPERFAPLASRAPGLGYHSGRVWVRFVVRNDGTSRQERWLTFDWPFQESVQLHLLDAQGQGPRLDSGSSVPVSERPVLSRRIIFPLALEAGEQRTAYLSIGGRAATVLRLEIWQPAHYADSLEARAATQYLARGSTFIAVVICAIAARVRRQPALLFGGFGTLLLLGCVFLLDGYGADLLPDGIAMGQNRLLQVVLFLALGCHTLFARSFLHLPERRPRLARWMLAACVLAMALAALTPFVVVPSLGSYVSTVYGVGLTAVALVCMRDDGRASQSYVASWGLLWAFGLLRNMQLFGWLPQLPFVVDSAGTGLVLASSALSVALYTSVRAVRDRADSAQRALIEQQRTEQTRLREAVTATTAELRQATRDAEQASVAKWAFVSMMSHELRAPLHTVLGFARLLQRDVRSEHREWVDAIERSGRGLQRMFDQVLSFSVGVSGSQQLDIGPVDLGRAGSQLVDDCSLLARRQHNRLRLQCQGGLPSMVMADEQRLLQVLRNLVENACKYSRDAEIVIDIGWRPAGPQDAGTARLCLAVSDTGPGIPADQHDAIFEPFGRLARDRHRQGVGLGLAIARQLVHAMGGELRLESTVGRGSRFYFDIALTPALQGALEHPDAQRQCTGYLGPRRRLLLVDDTTESLRFVAALCKGWGFEVVTAKNGIDALEALDLPGARFDAALVDQYMPAMTGWELLQELHERPSTADLPVFLMSAADPERPPRLDPAIGFDAVLRKPFTSSELADLLGMSLGIEWIVEPSTVDQADLANVRRRTPQG
jgi:signal transduction histidine kinase